MSDKKRIIVLGGDGFCGWPTSLHLSALGHDVVIVDNLSRRNIDNELEVESLTPIKPLGTRIKAWQEVSGYTIDFYNFDISKNYVRLLMSRLELLQLIKSLSLCLRLREFLK